MAPRTIQCPCKRQHHLQFVPFSTTQLIFRNNGLRKILIFGNSGSGKSTLARKLCETETLAHLDLDTLAWEPTAPPSRRPLELSTAQIMDFIQDADGWVIEGCYTDLLEQALPHATEIIYMNLPVQACIDNARARPWEPHKYASKEAQDANLEMLLDWIKQYTSRDDTFSQQAHLALFEKYPGKKTMVDRNQPTP